MSAVVRDFINVTANILTLSICIGLLFGVIAQPKRQKNNWWLALFLLTLALWALTALLINLPSLALLLNRQVSLYCYFMWLSLIPITFYIATITFCAINTRLTRILTPLSLPLLAIAWGLLWTGNLITLSWQTLAPDARLSTMIKHLQPTALGSILLILCLAYLGVAAVYVWFDDSEQSKSFRLPTVLLLGGLLVNFIPPLSNLPIDTVAVTIAAILLSYNAINQQLLNPLNQLNIELTNSNEELRATIADLATAHQRTADLNEELKITSQYKTEFLANMSHELRTPLNSIVGYSELLLQRLYGDLTDKQEDRLEKIYRNGRGLLNLINDILDLSKIESGRLELDLQHMSLNELLNNLSATFSQKAADKNLQLETHIATPLYRIYVDPLRIQQIITNLLSNAIKFTHEGQVKLAAFNVTVREGQTEDIQLPTLGWLSDGHWLLLATTDTGIGIEPENQAQIFDEFRQIDSTTTREFGGTGLGLAITKKLINLHNGRIWINSTPGQGSTFYVALPASSQAETIPPNDSTFSTFSGTID
ncbi:sensor histidine kinase [Chloroflexota bacterium]